MKSILLLGMALILAIGLGACIPVERIEPVDTDPFWPVDPDAPPLDPLPVYTDIYDVKIAGWVGGDVSFDVAQIERTVPVEKLEDPARYRFSVETEHGGALQGDFMVVTVNEENIDFIPETGDRILIEGELQIWEDPGPWLTTQVDWHYTVHNPYEALKIYATEVTRWGP